MEDNLVKIKSVANNIEAELIMNLLKNNNIQCLKKSREAGDYMNIYMGYSIFGEDIYVNDKDCDAALELLNSLSDDESLTDNYVSTESSIENNIDIDSYFDSVLDSYEESNVDFHTPYYKNPKILARIIILVTLGIVLLTTIINLMLF